MSDELDGRRPADHRQRHERHRRAGQGRRVQGGAFGADRPPRSRDATTEPAWPWPDPVRQQALDDVAEDLIKHGILDPDSLAVAPGYQKNMSWEKHSSLPTSGVIVKGCLDECGTCEPELGKLYGLEVAPVARERNAREADRTARKSHEYRCCRRARPRRRRPDVPGGRTMDARTPWSGRGPRSPANSNIEFRTDGTYIRVSGVSRCR